MKRRDILILSSVVALAAFVGNEAADARATTRTTQRVDGGSAAVEVAEGQAQFRDTRDDDDRPIAVAVEAEVRRRLTEGSAGTFIGEVLAAHDSSLARWPERRLEPLRVWIQPYSAFRDWNPAMLPIVRNAFVEWEVTGIPVSFTFVLDSASADVRVTWVDRFAEPISGKTLWTHDEQWWILDAGIQLAIHHRTGEPLDSAAVRAISLHEVGHLIGLDHTRDTTSIMAPRVRVKNLASVDIATAQLLYTLPPGRVGKAR